MGILLLILLVVLVVVIFLKSAEILTLVARIRFQEGDTEKALKLFKIADRLGGKPQTRMYYGYIMLRIGKLDTATELLTRASMTAKKTDLKKQIKSLLALATWKNGDLDGAIEMMEDAITDFKSTTFYQNLGLMYVLKGDAEKALRFNLEAYDYNPDDMVIMDNLAESYALCKETDKAKEMYETLLEKEPHFPEPYYNFGLLLIEEGEKDRGLELIEKSLDKKFTFLSILQKEEVEKLLEDAKKR